MDTVNLVTGYQKNINLVQPLFLRLGGAEGIAKFPYFSTQINSKKPLFKSCSARRLSRAKGAVQCGANAEGDSKGNNKCGHNSGHVFSAAQQF